MSIDAEPPRRASHSAVQVGSCILVISGLGWDDRRHKYPSKPLSSRLLWLYNLYTEQWRKLVIPNAKRTPVPFCAGVAVVIKEDIYTFGGLEVMREPGRPSGTNALWKMSKTQKGCFVWHNIKHKMEESPSPRWRHSGWAFAGKLWTFGGSGKSPTGYLNNHGDFHSHGTYGENNQLFCYDPVTEKWTNPHCFGNVPSPRRSHATSRADHDIVWLFGGSFHNQAKDQLFQLNMKTLMWTQIHAAHMRPHGRSQCTLTLLTSNKLVLHGTFKDISQNLLTDTWVLDLTSHTWRLYSSSKDHMRISHTGSCSLNNGVIIIGGGKNIGHSYDTYKHVFHVMLEPKSLQKLAMQIIYRQQDELPWKYLPKKLMALLGLSEKLDSKNKFSGPSSTSSSCKRRREPEHLFS